MNIDLLGLEKHGSRASEDSRVLVEIRTLTRSVIIGPLSAGKGHVSTVHMQGINTNKTSTLEIYKTYNHRDIEAL